MNKQAIRTAALTASALAVAVAMAGGSAGAADLPLSPPTVACHAIQHAALTTGDDQCCGEAQLCPRPLAMTVIRAAKRIQHT